MKRTKKTNAKGRKPGKIICRHCHKSIDKTLLIGFSLICPHCGKPGNGKSHKSL